MSEVRGRFIAFEGGEASGKSTQARRLASALGAVLTYEPGATSVGAHLRELLLNPDTGTIDPRTEALLMAADRAQHVAEVVEPALAAGLHVVSDRYAGSFLAYQGFGRGLPLVELRDISNWASGFLWPDLVVLLVASPAQAAARLGRDLDRFERQGGDFHRRVADGFAELASAEPDRWVVIDGDASPDAVFAAVADAVTARLGLAVPRG